MWSLCSCVMRMPVKFSGVRPMLARRSADLARRKAGIHQHAGLAGFDVGAIAGRTAAEDGEFDGHERILTDATAATITFRTELTQLP